MSSEISPVSVAAAGVLRRAWLDVAATAAPQLTDLPALLEARLNDLEAAGALAEASLLATAEEASQYAMEQGAGEVARALSKRLRRAIYEFLLALDAVNPAELANAPAVTPAAEPRTPVAFTPADVPGADEPAAPVPMWEAAAPPPPVREVYRVATRDVEPRDDVVAAEPVADEMGAPGDAVAAEFAAAESGSDVAEDSVVSAEAHAADVAEAVAATEQVDAEWAEPTNGVATEPPTATHPDGVDTAVEDAAAANPDDGVATDPTWPDATPDATQLDSAGFGDFVAATDPTSPDTAPTATHVDGVDTAVQAAAATSPGDGVATDPTWPDATTDATQLDGADSGELVAATDTASPDTTDATHLDSVDAAPEGVPADSFDHPAPAPEAPETPAPEWTTATADAPPASPPTNTPRPPRDLLRVPRQFRRLPPLPHRHHTNGSTPHTPVDQPAAALPPLTPEPPAPEAPHADEDDLIGVPAVPWTLAQQPEPPQPEPPAAEAELTEPEAEEQDLGVPFNPFAFTPDTPADLPRPPALAEEPLHPLPGATPAADLFIQPLPGNDAPQLWTPGPVPTPDYAQSRPAPAAPEPFPIAPREGFHLTDPGALDLTPAPAEPLVNTELPAPPPPPAAEEAHPDEHAHDPDEGWRIRQSPRAQLLAERMAQKRREEAARAAFEAATFHDEREHGRRKRGRHDDAPPDLPTARRQLDEHLRKKRGAEAGALLQRLAQELGGREIADLALDAGDRCRALGQSRSATNCYLAAWRADPLYETPLWRLSDVCLNDQEIDLAVGYLERIAELMRSRGDDEGAIGVYRKIAMIAPERKDVRDVIRLAKTTGRLDG